MPDTELAKETEYAVDPRELNSTYKSLRFTTSEQSNRANRFALSSAWSGPAATKAVGDYAQEDVVVDNRGTGTKNVLLSALSTTLDGKSPQELMQHLENLARLSDIVNSQVQTTVKALKTALT